jgi:hypothetical protein
MKQRGGQIPHTLISCALYKELLQIFMLQGEYFKQNHSVESVKDVIVWGLWRLWRNSYAQHGEFFKRKQTLFNLRSLQFALLHKVLRVYTSLLHSQPTTKKHIRRQCLKLND